MNHAAKLEQGEDEDFADYLGRQAEAWSQDPPPAPPGFVLIECAADRRHWPFYTVADEDFYEASCPMCQYDALDSAHAGCTHSRHRAWRRWRITGRLASFFYCSGLTASGGGMQWGGGCDGCVTLPSWGRGRRVYVLWVRTDRWRCLMRGRHWPAYDNPFGFCTKCLPCPDCGSTTAGHEPGCPTTASAMPGQQIPAPRRASTGGHL